MNLISKPSLAERKRQNFGVSVAHVNKHTQPLAEDMVQMVLDFNSSPTLMELIDARRAISEPTFFDKAREAKEKKLHEQVKASRELNKAGREDAVSESSALHALLANEGMKPVEGVYIDFAITMLQSSAQDLVMTNRILQEVDPGTPAHRNATELRQNTLYWLAGAESLFPFKDCANLLEQEIRLQSDNQIDIPKLYERSDELASWIANNPKEAKKMLSAYQSIFSNYTENNQDDDGDEEFLFEDSAQTRSRSMRVRHG